jgi:hypothetical protein
MSIASYLHTASGYFNPAITDCNDHVKDDVMDRICSTHGEDTRPRRRLEDTLKWILETWDGWYGMIDLAHDRDEWKTLVNTVIRLRVS